MLKTNIFEKNKIMQIIGQQSSCDYINRDFVEVLNTLKETGTQSIFDVALTFYILGIVTGKRVERAERNRREYEPITK